MTKHLFILVTCYDSYLYFSQFYPLKGQIECWDVFNEPLHGDSNPNGEIFIEAFGEGIWNEIMERVKVKLLFALVIFFDDLIW